jgi:SNF2 family DNA or RNA helicase
MDIITQELGTKYRVVRLDGNVPTEQRQDLVDFFNLSVRKSGKEFDADCPAPVFLIQVKTGGQGLNLQAATRIYITSPSWNPSTELQAIARAHRTGQKREVHVKRFVYTSQSEDVNSIDECLVKLQEKKSNITALLLDDERIIDQIPGSLKNISVQEIRKIFSRHVPNG